MGALPVFIAIAVAACSFLLYFLYALLREEYGTRKRREVEITELPSRKPQTAKLIRLTSEKTVRQRKKL